MRRYTTPRFAIERWGSSGVVMDALPAAGKGRNTRTYLARIEAGGTLGEHEATMRQVFALVAGRCRTSTDRAAAQVLEAGQLVVWERGELHQTWAEEDSLVVIVETDAELELPEHFEPLD